MPPKKPESVMLTPMQLAWCRSKKTLVFRPAIFRALLAQLGLNKNQCAKLLGVTATAVGRWVNGTRSPSPSQIALMQAAFKKLQLQLRHLPTSVTLTPQTPPTKKA